MRTGVLAGAALLSVSVPTDAVAQTDWRRLPLLDHYRDAACALDTARNRIVLFGGASNTGRIGDTFEWDGSDWRRAAPTNSPAPRDRTAAVYDPVRGRVVLFGGRTATGELDDTWEWDGSDWTARSPAVAPPARSMHAMTWDGGRQRVLVFGGFTAGSQNNDTWEWDGATWTERTPLHRPPALAGAAMAWDAVRDRVVLFGGGSCMYWNCGSWNTWEWDGNDWTDASLPWQQSPPARWNHSMIYDASRQRIVVFGGSDEPSHYKGDTWEWDGATWTERVTPHVPVDRLGQGMVYDPVTQRTLVAGGESFFGMTSDLWALDPADWHLVHPGQQPNPGLYEQFDAAWDGDHDGVLWYGVGIGAYGFRETWLLREDRWTLVAEGQGAEWPEQHRLQWLPNRHRMILHRPPNGSWPEATWEFDGATWSQIATANMPGARGGFDLAIDPRFDRLVLFGGHPLTNPPPAQTWLFDGVDWQQAMPATSPPERNGHAMALDPPRRRVVLFGGRTASGLIDDTWEWDGSNWLQRTPSHAPSPREGHRMAFDCGRRRTILHGGDDASGNRTDTWEWNGEDWTLRSPATAPPHSFRQILAHDCTSGATFCMAAFADGTWRYAPAMRGEFAPLASGCGGSLGAPILLPEFGQRPYVGMDFHLTLLRLPGPFAFGISGFSTASFSLAPFGFPNCELRVQPDFAVLLPLQNGVGRWTTPIPNDPGLIGVQFFDQALALDPLGPDGLAMTPATASLVGGP